MITQFNEWSSGLAETSGFSGIHGATVGIEASEYLNRIQDFKLPLTPEGQQQPVQNEPLVPALGGLPFSLGRIVNAQLDTLKKHGIKPVFVFSGLNLQKDDFAPSEAASRKLDEAWRHYEANNAQMAVEAFRTCGAIKAQDLFRFLQSILKEREVPWVVAPYTATAQLYYLTTVKAVDTVFASSEIFLHDINEAITSWNFESESLVWVRRRNCIQSLGNVTPDAFLDSCLLAGCDLSPPLPQLEIAANRRDPKIKSACNLVMNVGKGSGNGVCLHYQDDAANRMQDYTELFRKARMTVKHSVIVTEDGKTEPLDLEHAPGMIHEFFGQRLPDELYGYFAHGIIGPRILNWRVGSEILMHPPLDGGDSKEYRELVRTQLTPIQTLTIGLLASPLNFYYQRTDMTKKVWFDKEKGETISIKNDFDKEKTSSIISSWNVTQAIFGEEFNKYPGTTMLGLCVKSLNNSSFATRTKQKKSRNLISKDELLANSIWRMLHLRDYIDDSHNLTATGKMLLAIVEALPLELQESALVAAELIRYGRLSGESSPYPGIPDAGADNVKKAMTLVAKVACLGELDHEAIGYTGILSRNMLSYGSIVEAVRCSLRDLLEVCLTTLLLNGDANRDRPDWSDLGLDLPLLNPVSSCLGIAVANHLTEISKLPDPKNDAARQRVLEEAQQKFRYAPNISNSFEKAWKMWDAVNKGVQAADSSKLGSTKAAIKNADDWLKVYR